MQRTGDPNMIIRTTVNLRKFEARRPTKRGYEILHIETQHRDDGDHEIATIVWTRPPRPDDIPDTNPLLSNGDRGRTR